LLNLEQCICLYSHFGHDKIVLIWVIFETGTVLSGKTDNKIHSSGSHLLQTSTNMSNKVATLSNESKERLAVQIVAASERLISVPKAMREVGFDTPSRKNNAISKRVCRAAKRLVIVDEKTVSSSATVVASTPSKGVSTVVAASIKKSSVFSLSNPPSNPQGIPDKPLVSWKPLKSLFQQEGKLPNKRTKMTQPSCLVRKRKIMPSKW